MSLKADVFSTILPAPKTLDKFCVMIPGVIDSPVRVSATTLPQEYKATSSITMCGVSLYVPTTASYSGTWKCTVDESLLGDALAQLKLIQRGQNVRTKKSGSFISTIFISPMIFITDQITGAVPVYWCTLDHAYLESISEVSLDWSKADQPIKWELTFRYSTIKRFPKV